MIVYLTFDNLITLAGAVTAPTKLVLRDVGMLESAAARPRTTVYGADAYATLSAKAAAVMHLLARNHALVDGNKRLAWHATTVFLLLNGVNLEAPSVNDGEAFVVSVAQGKLEIDEIATQIGLWCRPSIASGV